MSNRAHVVLAPTELKDDESLAHAICRGGTSKGSDEDSSSARFASKRVAIREVGSPDRSRGDVIKDRTWVANAP